MLNYIENPLLLQERPTPTSLYDQQEYIDLLARNILLLNGLGNVFLDGAPATVEEARKNKKWVLKPAHLKTYYMIHGPADNDLTAIFVRTHFRNGLAKKLGVNTDYRFFIAGLNTDGQTQKVEDFCTTKHWGDNLKTATEYYFDEKGRFGKVAILPKEFPDNRINLGPYLSHNMYKAVESTMHGEDFNIAAKVLSTIEQKLTTYSVKG